MKTKEKVEMRVVCMFGAYGVHKCVVDKDGDILRVGDNLLAKGYPTYSALIHEIEGMLMNLTLPITHVNQCNRRDYGI